MAASEVEVAHSPAPAPRLATLALPLVAALGIACGITVLLVTVFNYLAEPIARDLGLSRTGVASALSLHLAMLIFAIPLAGVLADRFGARPVIVTSALLFGGALYLASLARDATQLHLAFAAAGVLGAGASPVSYARVIVHRFSAHRGLALGVALTGTGIGGILLPMLVQPVVSASGWREALMALALLVAVVGVVAGLATGGDSRARQGEPGAAGHSLREAAGTSAFWRMTCAFALLGIALSGVIAHLTGIFGALGLDPARVPAFQAAMGVATIAGRLVGGALMDRMPARYVGGGAAIVGALGMALLAMAPGITGLMLVAIAIGICTGTESDVVSYLSSRFFGLREFARIYGVQGSFFMIGFAAGPVAAAAGFATFGTVATLLAAAALLVASALALLSLRAPEAKVEG